MVEGPMRATRKSMQAAKRQRRNMSPPEIKLWALLRRSPGGVKFKRQHAVGPYVADFYCSADKLVIEIDGLIHDFTVERDGRRDEYIRGLGLRILRIPAADVMRDSISVADGLVRLCGPSTTQLR
jgi:very-short-patch-repair endonuclease